MSRLPTSPQSPEQLGEPAIGVFVVRLDLERPPEGRFGFGKPPQKKEQVGFGRQGPKRHGIAPVRNPRVIRHRIVQAIELCGRLAGNQQGRSRTARARLLQGP